MFEYRSFKPRWRAENTPIMCGHMNIDIWLYNYLARLPRTRKNMMFDVRVRFRDKRFLMTKK